MKINELMDELFQYGKDSNYTHTCDTCKCGDPEREVKKVAVTMMPTAAVLRQAAEWGADLLIDHEPIYYTHHDNIEGKESDPVIAAKKKLAEETGMAIYRLHDHMHHNAPDLICAGELAALQLPGKVEPSPYYAVSRLTLDTPITPLELARRLEERTGVAHIRVIGAANTPMTKVSCCFGTPGHLTDELRNGQELVLAGEVDEWSDGEYFRDAAAFGMPVAMLVMGHIGSERDGMKLLAEEISRRHPTLAVRYFECGEVYSYTDSKK